MFKNYTRNKIVFCFNALMLLLLIVSCNSSSVVVGNDIPKREKNNIHILVDSIYKSLQEGNVNYLRSITSSKVAADEENGYDSIIYKIKFSSIDTGKSLIGEYYITHPANGINKIFSNGNFNLKYNFEFLGRGSKTYAYLFLVPAIRPSNKLLIQCIFSQEEDNWKLSGLLVARFEYNNQNPIDLYNRAKTFLQNGNLIGAYLYSQLSMELITPLSSNFHFNDENFLKQFYSSIVARMRRQFTFPIIVHLKHSIVKIYTLNEYFYEKGAYPIIQYQTNHYRDSLFLKNENLELNEKIDSIFPAINQITDTVLYQAFSDTSNGGIINHFFNQKLIK